MLICRDYFGIPSFKGDDRWTDLLRAFTVFTLDRVASLQWRKNPISAMWGDASEIHEREVLIRNPS